MRHATHAAGRDGRETAERGPRFRCAWLAAVLLTSCSVLRVVRQQQAVDQYQADVAAIQADCQAKRNGGAITTNKAFVDCLTPGYVQAYQRSGQPNADLVGLFFARWATIAERLDGGQVTESEAKAQVAELSSSITTEWQNRDVAERRARAEEAVANRYTQPPIPVVTGGPVCLHQNGEWSCR